MQSQVNRIIYATLVLTISSLSLSYGKDRIQLGNFSALEIQGASESLFISFFEGNPNIGYYSEEFSLLITELFPIGTRKDDVIKKLLSLKDSFRHSFAVDIKINKQVSLVIKYEFSDSTENRGLSFDFTNEDELRSFSFFEGHILTNPGAAYNPVHYSIPAPP